MIVWSGQLGWFNRGIGRLRVNYYELMPGVGHVVTKDGVKLTIDLFRKTIS